MIYGSGHPRWRFLLATTLLLVIALGLFGCAVYPPPPYPYPPPPVEPYPGYWDAWPEYRFGFGFNWQWGYGHGWDHHWHNRGGHR